MRAHVHSHAYECAYIRNVCMYTCTYIHQECMYVHVYIHVPAGDDFAV